uniref:Uracil phosphoribosyltransferase n=1 Tax=Taenioma perpusillum TaxID=210852 RepID=A0A1Z1MR78_9FLOR|nr:uracil phosphoribosyltransferase [Taenioma perpusillum]ARW68603.1 uracil phosphoribosyltransferase [Taenioma perpusillum]
MQLNVYLISHPIFKILLNNEKQKNSYKKKYIGIFLIYEILRKEINILNMYVKQINQYKNFYRLNKVEEHYLITNLTNTASIIGEIEICMPQIQILHISNTNKNILKEALQKVFHNLNKNKKIIIFDTILDLNYVISITNFLTNEININIDNIIIGTFISNNQILNQIGQKYPKLSIYTTKIIL